MSIAIKYPTNHCYNERPNHRAIYYMKEMQMNQYIRLIGGRCGNDQERREAFAKMKTYVNRIFENSGTLKCEYTHSSKNGGRIKCGTGIQGQMRELRGVLFTGHTTDIDAVNCAPTIVNWLCKKHGVDNRHIDYYCKNRDECLARLGKPRDEAKMDYIISMYSGKRIRSDPNKSKRIVEGAFNDFDDNMKEVQLAFSKMPEYQRFYDEVPEDKKKENPLGCGFNRVVLHFEDKIMDRIAELLKEQDIEICTPMFDGVLVYGDHYKDCELIAKIESAVNYTFAGLNMKYAYKGHDTTIQVPHDFECPDQIETNILEGLRSDKAYKMIELQNELSVAELYNEINGHNIRHIGKDMWYKYNPHTSLWKETDGITLNHGIAETAELYVRQKMKAIDKEMNKLMELADPANSKKILGMGKKLESLTKFIKKIGAGSFLKNARGHLAGLDRVNDPLFKGKLNKTENYIAVKDGLLLNLVSMETRPRMQEDMWSVECPCRLISERKGTVGADSRMRDAEDVEKLRVGRKYFADLFPNPAVRQIAMNAIKTTFTGVRIRNIFFWIGTGNNGKSLLLDLIREMFPTLTATLSKDVLIKNKAESKLTTELEIIEHIRFGMGSELEETDRINEKQVKNLTGDEFINIRGMRETNRDIRIACTQHYASNVMPEMNFSDRALMKRVYPIPFTNMFEINPDFKNEMRANIDGIFTALLLDGKIQRTYEKDESLPEEMKECNKAYIESRDIWRQFLTECCIHDVARAIPRTCDDRNDMTRETFMAHFKAYCIKNGGRYEEPTANAFTKNMARLGIKTDRKHGTPWLIGVSMKPEPKEPEQTMMDALTDDEAEEECKQEEPTVGRFDPKQIEEQRERYRAEGRANGCTPERRLELAKLIKALPSI